MSAFAFAVTAFEPPRWPRETACQILGAAPRSIDPSRSAFDGSYEGWVASVTGATGVGSTVSDDCSTNSTVTHPHRSISDSSGATSTGRVTLGAAALARAPLTKRCSVSTTQDCSV